MRKLILYISLIFSFLLAAACSHNQYGSLEKHPSVSSISEEWLEIKKGLYQIDIQEDYQSILSNIDKFNIMFNNFIISPVGKMYQSYKEEIISEELIKALLNIDTLLEKLKTAVQNSDGLINAQILSSILEVDTIIESLQFNDANLSNTILQRIYLLFFFLTLLIIIVIIVIQILYSRFEKMETRERQSMLFSREIVNAQEHERKRIAREFHDTVAQDLWRLSFQIENEKLADEQRAVIQRIRSICDTLIPPDFQRRGLINALKKLMFEFEQRTGIECHITIHEDIALKSMDNDTQLQCYRIVQESLTNIEKHAQAAEVLLLVRQKDSMLLISVSDNGKGFVPPDYDSCIDLQTKGHMGLWSMYERAASISGTLTIISDSEGTMINLQVPLAAIEGVI